MRILIVALLAGCGSSADLAPAPTLPPPKPVEAATPTGTALAPPVSSVKRYDAKTFLETTSVRAAGFSHDGTKVLLGLDTSGPFNLYSIAVTGGEPVRLTTSTETQEPAGYFPKDDRFLYLEDRGGNELHHLYVVEAGGTPKDLTPGEKLKASFLGWSADDKSFFVLTNERDAKAFDLYRYAVKDYKRELAWKNDFGAMPNAVSRDGRWLALTKPRTNADSDVYLVDLKAKGAKPKLITAHKGDVEHMVYTFAPDSKKLWYGTNAHGQFRQAWSYDLATGKHLVGVAAEWDVDAIVISEKGRYAASVTNEDGAGILHVIDTKTGKEVTLPSIPLGNLTGVFFSRSEEHLGLVLSTDRTPHDLFVIQDLGKGALRQLTHALGPKLDAAQLVEGETVRYPSFDGMKIPAILYKPKDAAPERKVPALVFTHGGPGGQFQRGYQAVVQFLVNHGYGVISVNNRGSSGYGKAFYHLDDRKHGDVDLKDCVFAGQYLASLEWVDGKRVGIIGGSYGGYLVGAALAFHPDAFALGIDIFGVMNWVRTLESMPAWWAARRDALIAELGDPVKDKERLRSISPLFHADKIRKPLLVIQGANDPRVIKVESDEIVAAVKKNGVPVEYVVFEDEGHGFTKKKNRIAALEVYLRFLQKYL